MADRLLPEISNYISINIYYVSILQDLCQKLHDNDHTISRDKFLELIDECRVTYGFKHAVCLMSLSLKQSDICLLSFDSKLKGSILIHELVNKNYKYINFKLILEIAENLNIINDLLFSRIFTGTTILHVIPQLSSNEFLPINGYKISTDSAYDDDELILITKIILTYAGDAAYHLITDKDKLGTSPLDMISRAPQNKRQTELNDLFNEYKCKDTNIDNQYICKDLRDVTDEFKNFC